MTTSLNRREVRELMQVKNFARRLVGEPLFDYQLEVAESEAKVRVMCAGRQVGKSRTLAVICLHYAFTRPGSMVLVISTTEDNARDLMRTISGLASSPWLGGSVDRDDSTRLQFSNGSEIRCIPASQRRARGLPVDLLVVDEAAHVDEDVWRAAQFSIAARPDARVLLASTPRPGMDRFFARYWHLGKQGREGYQSFWWPSWRSPLVSEAQVKEWRETEPPRIFAQEIEAKWVDEAGAYFTVAEVEACTADYEMESPSRAAAEGRFAESVAGVDWGFSSDSNALCVLGAMDDRRLNARELGLGRLLYVRWVEARAQWPYPEFVRYLADAAEAFQLRFLVSELNGVGVAPTQELWAKLRGHYTRVVPVNTDVKRKETGFGALKVLLAQRRIVLPKESPLPSQLLALEYETLPSGNVRISAPERGGQHDDAAMALCQALSAVWASQLVDEGHVPGADVRDRLAGMERMDFHNARARALRGVEDGSLETVRVGAEPAAGDPDARTLTVPRRPAAAWDGLGWSQYPLGAARDRTGSFNW